MTQLIKLVLCYDKSLSHALAYDKGRTPVTDKQVCDDLGGQ
jgi:hypothetical protein